MADRKLLAVFPEANRPLDPIEAENYLCGARDRYGDIQTFFGLAVYQNPVGIELEVENFNTLQFMPYYWSATDDNSLKKHGMELISMPLRGKNIDYALHELNELTKLNKWTFGHRTSLHVHCNVSTYTMRQLRTLTALYACMEELFFSFTTGVRTANTFCYRLVGTPAELEFYKSDKEGDTCTKYCAFNIQPVRRQMTVEFRHLEGTQDIKRIRRWIQLCGKLVGYVEGMNPKTCVEEILGDIVNGVLPERIQEIWGDTAEALFSSRQVAESVNNGSLWAVALLTKE
jgi:Putative amidoligase enzyme